MLDDAPTTPTNPNGTPPHKSSNSMMLAIGAVCLVIAFAALKPQGAGDEKPSHHAAQSSFSSDSKDKMALLINVNGKLCAAVIDITRISGDLYRATCTKYRDGTGTATYEVDAATGTVK